MDIPVTDDGIRPAGSPTHCLYCSSPKGQHKDDCVCVSRTVVVEMTVRYVIEVPRSWSEDDILFSRNESSRCASNDVAMLGLEAELECFCKRSEVEFLREATEEDHDALGYNARKQAEPKPVSGAVV